MTQVSRILSDEVEYQYLDEAFAELDETHPCPQTHEPHWWQREPPVQGGSRGLNLKCRACGIRFGVADADYPSYAKVKPCEECGAIHLPHHNRMCSK